MSRPSTLAALARFAAASHPDVAAFRLKSDDGWEEQTYAAVADKVDRLAAGLVDLGVEPGERVCILANTRPEWSLAALAVWSAGAVVVPIYPTNSPEECHWVASDSGAVAIVCENADQLAKIEQVRADLPALRHTILIEAAGRATGAVLLDELHNSPAAAAQLDERIAALSPQEPMLFVYTSGTTGPPKGCVLTHANVLATCEAVLETDTVRAGDAVYLYLPLAHIFAQLVNTLAFLMGGTVAYFSGDTRQIITEIQETRPTVLPSVPRIFEKIYALGIAQLDEEQQARIRAAVANALEVRALQTAGQPVPDDKLAAFQQADEEIFANIRALFGGNLRASIVGAAPIAAEILELFHAAGVPVYEGYGLTETTGVATFNTPAQFSIGSIGRPLAGVQARIADDGEILLSGPNLFAGYHNNPAATEEVLVDGWLHTGDLGAIDGDGFLRITGRKKDIIITAGGKNLTPVNLENDLKQSPFISQAVMYGDRRPYPVALITLDMEHVGPWAQQRDLPAEPAALAEASEVRELIQAALDAANARYAQVEQIKRFKILDRDLTQETGELTATLKVKRNVVYQRHAGLFDSLYS